MKGKAALVIGLATGYVLGTRDGRERYEQIKTQANRLMNDPRVQEKASQATDLAKQKAPVLKDKVADATKKAGGKHSADDTGSADGAGWGTDTGSRTGSPVSDGVEGASEEGAIIVTAPPPSPLAPGATSENTTSGGLGG
ncbi:MAG: hypothetical protein QOF53_3353 [Nocardioidaceae bacterium]|jgi:hypothetical protein|nr:hypothetical protein [Nocardioidaceae bacterium]